MKILITGPYGFVASQLVFDLLAEKYQVIACAKDINFAKKIFPDLEMVYADFNKDTSKEVWLPRLREVDVVINCVGILHANRQNMWRIHYETPRALFEASQLSHVKKIIQISALGVDDSDVLFAKTKKAADDYLENLGITSVVVRPSLVYGTGSFGGTSLFRGLAGLPGFIPVPRGIDPKLQPIHIKDLSHAIVKLIQQEHVKSHDIVNAVGPQQYSLYQIIFSLREWLGFGKAVKIKIPLTMIKFFAKCGDYLKLTFNSTLLQMSFNDNVTTLEESQRFEKILGYKPKNLKEALQQQPSYVQDRWHARLYFLRPMLRLSLGFLWFYSGLISLIGYPHTLSYELLSKIGINSYQSILLYGASILDMILGVLTLWDKKILVVASIQIILIIVYTALVTIKIPEFWLHPFAPIAKNIPLLIATMIMIALESKR